MATSTDHATAPARKPANEVSDVLIIGGGPAGLAVGYGLKRLGVRFLILEHGSSAGESWRRMPSNLKLVSPWKANDLPGSRPGLFPANHEASREEYCRYLQDYATQHTLPIRTSVHVSSVTQNANGLFQATTSQGDFAARTVINATGYFSKPFIPTIPGAMDSCIPQLHVADYKSPEHLKLLSGGDRSPILIVGKRLSAGQTLVELVDAGFTVALSHRSPIEFGPDPLALWFFFRIFLELENIKIRLLGSQTRGWDVKMPGGRPKELIQRGTVKTYPEIQRVEGRSVIFENGITLQPSVILYATGFRPALDHLRPLLTELNADRRLPRLSRMESASVPGLFFLGLQHQRNLQSHYLRGIRRDANILAAQLAARLRV